MLCGKLNRFALRVKSTVKSVDMPVNLLAPAFYDKLKLNITQR